MQETAPPEKKGAVGIPAEREEEAPPWDMEPPPLPEEAPPPPKRAAGPVPEREEYPQGEKPSGKAMPAGDFWPGLVTGLRGRIPMGEYSFLSNPAMVRGTVDGPLLTLWAQSDFVKDMIAKPGILAVIEKAVNQLPGGPYRAVVTVGIPEEAPAAANAREEHDKLDDLLALGKQFGDIITEE